MTDETQLLRQVHPAFVQVGKITSQVFRPTPKDQALLSVYDGDLIDPEQSWLHFTKSGECKSAGVMAGTVLECKAEALNARPDPNYFLEHAVIDFSGLSDG